MINKILIFFALAMMVLLPLVADAEPSPKHAGELGTEISYIKCEEPGLMEEEGVMWGILGSYTYHDKLMLRIEGRYSYGQVDYDGELSDGTSYTISDIDDYMLKFRGLGGYDFRILTSTTITPYIGFGYRYLNDDPSFDPAAYERESNYYYSPIGIESFTKLKNGWSAGLAIEYDLFWKGLQKTHWGDWFAGLDTAENEQKDGYGVRGSIKFQKEGNKTNFIIEPFVIYWDIEKSEIEPITYSGTPIGIVGWEPANHSLEIGIKLAVNF